MAIMTEKSLRKVDKDRRAYLKKHHKEMYYSTPEQKRHMRDLMWSKSKMVV